MSDDLSLASQSSAEPTAAPAEAAPSAPSGPPSGVPFDPSDTRGVAAELLRGMEDGENKAAPPAATPSPESPSLDAATSVGQDDADYQSLLASGAIPTDRHKAVVTNTRNKTRAEVEAEFQGRYGWVDQLAAKYGGADQNRIDYALGLMAAIDGPNAEQALRTVAYARGIDLAPKPQAEPKAPPKPHVLQDGSKWWDADGVEALLANQAATFEARLAEMDKRFRPLHEQHALAELQKQATSEAGELLTRYRTRYKHFQGLEPEIKRLMQADPALTLSDAYAEALETKGIPALQSQFETDRASQLQRKAAASSAPPSAPRAVTPLRDADRSTRDIAREVMSAVS